MSAVALNTTISLSRFRKVLWLIPIIFLLSATVTHAQNTKGDKPSANRESRFKTPFKKGKQRGKATAKKRVRPRTKSNAARATASTPRRASGKDRPGKPIRPIERRQPSNKQRAWRGDIAGYKIRTKTPSGRTHNVYPQHGMFVHNPSKKPKPTERAVSNRGALARLQGLQSGGTPDFGPKKRVSPRSASRSYTARKSINVYASFPRPKRKGEHASTRDLAGRRLRSKNFETPRRAVLLPTFKGYGRRPMGERAYSGRASGGYRTASRSGTPWKGDIAGRRIRRKNYTSHKEGEIILPTGAKDRYGLGSAGIGRFQGNIKGRKRPEKGGGSVSGQSWNNRNQSIGGGSPDQGSGVARFQGNIKGRRPLKGGGSVSGNTWNNNGQAIGGGRPTAGAGFAHFQGNIKTKRPYKGGGSVSGQTWNNDGRPIGGGRPDQGAAFAHFQGNIKTKRPFKGGGSVSGQSWNNNGQPIGGGRPDQGAAFAHFQGNIKTKRPLKGGGSVSGRVWNNNGKPVGGGRPSQYADVARFQGNLKTRRPDKGGGSVSGQLWNNKETPIAGRTPPGNAARIGGYPGKLKRFETQPGFADQGSLFTGYIKLNKFKKNYVQNPNTSDLALKKRRPGKTTYEADGLQVRVKRPDYIENKNSSEDALLKLRPSKNTFQAGELQVKIKEKEYGRKPHASENALPGIKPTQSTVKASTYARSVRRNWDYIHNPSSANEALKTREPGKAFGQSTAYQGNIKMQKFSLYEKNRALHPDTKFIKLNKNNVDDERDMLTNIKLLWAKFFKKQETQPDHLKYKGKKPRYDKGEDGMWNE